MVIPMTWTDVTDHMKVKGTLPRLFLRFSKSTAPVAREPDLSVRVLYSVLEEMETAPSALVTAAAG
jgi:hypothetical protein